MSFALARPIALLLLAAVPLYLWAARRSALSVPMPRADALREVGGAAAILGYLPTALRVLALVSLVLALAGPTSAATVVEERREGVPIVLAIDISSSMLAQDFSPRDRLEVAKATIARFIEAREGDPIGLVAFAGEALTLVPATTHRSVLGTAVQSIRVGLLEDGTAIGDGLAAAVNRLRHLQRENGVIVILSDGENNRGVVDPLAAADAAATLGLEVYTVGVGSEGVAQVPVGTAETGFRYTELAVGLDEELLREVAERTGGEYFRATDSQALASIYAEIDRMVPSIVETTRRVESTEWAVVFLLAAALLLAGEWLLRGSRWGVVP